MTPRLLLNSTKPKDYARNAREEMRGEWCVCVCPILHPPCIYSREPWVRSQPSLVNRHWEPMRRRHMAGLRWWGPRARSADQVGRSACLGHQPPPTSSGGLSWASLSDLCWGWPVLTCLNWVLASLLVLLSLNWCSDNFCDFMSDQSVLVTYILA